jgi:XTP/dITP diphosphohydrolase
MPAAVRQFLLATRNRHKLRELRELLAGLRVELLPLQDLVAESVEGEDAVESHGTFEENAVAKARFFRTLTGMDVIADDSGLCVHALADRPGVRSRRFAPGTFASGAEQDAANNAHLLDRLRGVPEARRRAHYRCSVALLAPDRTLILNGRVDGVIALAPRGDHGFGYDPLFILGVGGRTFGELPPTVKAERSHRAVAIRSLRRWLDAYSTSEDEP